MLVPELSSLVDRWAALLAAGSIVLVSFQDLYQTRAFVRDTPTAYKALVPTSVHMPVYWHSKAQGLRRRIRKWVVRGGFFFVTIMTLLVLNFVFAVCGIDESSWRTSWANFLGVAIDSKGSPTELTFSNVLPTLAYYSAKLFYWCTTKEAIRGAAELVAIGVITSSAVLVHAMLEVRRIHLETADGSERGPRRPSSST